MRNTPDTPSPSYLAGQISGLFRCIGYRVASRAVMVKHDNGLYTESVFRSMLVLERKRTERSKRPFQLIRIPVAGLPSGTEGENLVASIAQSICSVIRETDIVGWLAGGREIGVVATDIDRDAGETILSKILQSITSAVSDKYKSLLFVSGTVFPVGGEMHDDSKRLLNSVLYTRSSCGAVGDALAMACKRGIDIIGSICAILLFLPLFLVIPVLIRLGSGGKAFFCQERIGRYGKPFRCIKFRTMVQCNDDSIHRDFVKKFIAGSMNAAPCSDDTRFKIKDDPRVTAIGRFLRKTSLDELPQFFNVLFGHMSIVGPRPAIGYEVEAYDLWHRRRVLEMKPGITGIWQVEGRSRTDFDSMTRLDIQYINSWSPLLDLRLIFTTPIAMVTAKGAC